MVTLSAYVGDGIYEKETDTQNAKMSGLNQHKEENEGFVSSSTYDCVSCLNFFSVMSKEHIFLFFCMKVVCIRTRRLVIHHENTPI